MGILSGFEKYKRHLKVDDENYKLVSEWTHADTVEMTDGKSLSESIVELTEELNQNTDEKITELTQDMNDKITEVNSNMYYDQNENILYIKLTDGTLFPLVNDCTNKLIYDTGAVYYNNISLVKNSSAGKTYIRMYKDGEDSSSVIRTSTPIDVTKYNKLSIKCGYDNNTLLLDADISDIKDEHYIEIQANYIGYNTLIRIVLLDKFSEEPLVVESYQLTEPYDIYITRIKLLYNIV